ncbi:MAG TPA: hypothetical protein VL737_00795 [Candidatus Pristimantibacillus sp.]|nr:hypothetical protein [Candidatus Pristimantibacillus sp.]
MKHIAIRYIYLSELSFVMAAVLCLLINAKVLFTSDGISFYGNFRNTIVPYVVGLALSGWFLARAADHLPADGRENRLLRTALRISAISLMGIIITPSFAGGLTSFVHVSFGGFLFLTQAVVSWSLLGSFWSNWTDRLLFMAHIAAVVAIILSFRRIGLLNLMIPAQVTALLAFGALSARMAGRLAHE